MPADLRSADPIGLGSADGSAQACCAVRGDAVRFLGVVAGLATAAHGLGELISFDKLAHTYASGDAAARAAVRVNAVLPSAVDPRGLYTFGITGAAVLISGYLVRDSARRLGWLGIVLGVDMLLLFLASAVDISGLVLVTGGLASVILGPTWWVFIGRQLRQPPPVHSAVSELNGSGWARQRVGEPARS
jgi:hypothetical protein